MVDTQLISDLKALRQVWDSKQWIKYAMSMDECRQTCIHPIKDAAAVCLLGGIEYTVPRNVCLNRYSDVFDSLRDTLTERGVLSPLYVWNDEQESVEAIYKLIDQTIARLEGVKL